MTPQWGFLQKDKSDVYVISDDKTNAFRVENLLLLIRIKSVCPLSLPDLDTSSMELFVETSFLHLEMSLWNVTRFLCRGEKNK